MGNIFTANANEKDVLMFGLEKAGKTHLLYN